jgi:hypothetical protein
MPPFLTSNIATRQPHIRKHWPTMPTSNIATRQTSNVTTRPPLRRKRWPTMHASNFAESRPNALQSQQSWRWPWSKLQYWQICPWPSWHWPKISGARRKLPKNSTVRTTSTLWCRYCRPPPLTQQFGTFGQNALYVLLLLMPSWPRFNAMTLRTRHELRQQQPCHIQRPCCPPPPCPMTYVGVVLSTMGGSTHATSLALAPSAIPSPTVNGQLRTVR